jgi:hypothetical protein
MNELICETQDLDIGGTRAPDLALGQRTGGSLGCLDLHIQHKQVTRRQQ